MEENVFRTAVEPILQAPETRSEHADLLETVYDTTDMPPSLYREALKEPYVAEMLGATLVYDQHEIRRFSEAIDKTVIQEIRDNRLPDTKESYEGIIQSALEELNFPDTASLHVKLEKLAEYLKLIAKIKTPIHRNDIGKPLGSMSTRELRTFIQQKYGIQQI